MHDRTFSGIFAVSMRPGGGGATSQPRRPADRFAEISGGFCEIQNGTFLEGKLGLHEWLYHVGLHTDDLFVGT